MISDITHHATHDIMTKVLKYDKINSLLFDFWPYFWNSLTFYPNFYTLLTEIYVLETVYIFSPFPENLGTRMVYTFTLDWDPGIECHKYFHLVWENNHAVSAKQRSSCKDVYRVHDNSKMWPLLNFHELRNFLLSKNPLNPEWTKLFLQKWGQHISTPAELRKST